MTATTVRRAADSGSGQTYRGTDIPTTPSTAAGAGEDPITGASTRCLRECGRGWPWSWGDVWGCHRGLGRVDFAWRPLGDGRSRHFRAGCACLDRRLAYAIAPLHAKSVLRVDLRR